jgi:hypothetical protein
MDTYTTYTLSLGRYVATGDADADRCCVCDQPLAEGQPTVCLGRYDEAPWGVFCRDCGQDTVQDLFVEAVAAATL